MTILLLKFFCFSFRWSLQTSLSMTVGIRVWYAYAHRHVTHWHLRCLNVAIQSTGVCQLLVTPIDHWSLCFYNEMSDVQVKTNVCFSLVCCRHVLKSINFIPREYAPRRAGRPYVYTYVRARKKSDITSFDVTARVNN